MPFWQTKFRSIPLNLWSSIHWNSSCSLSHCNSFWMLPCINCIGCIWQLSNFEDKRYLNSLLRSSLELETEKLVLHWCYLNSLCNFCNQRYNRWNWRSHHVYSWSRIKNLFGHRQIHRSIVFVELLHQLDKITPKEIGWNGSDSRVWIEWLNTEKAFLWVVKLWNLLPF